jgi:hypothetical protein
MQKIKNFDGSLIATVKQTNKKGEVTAKQIKISGFRVLDTKRIAATLAAAIFQDISIYKKLGKKLFTSTLPLELHVSDGSKHTIFSTATMEQEVIMQLKPRNVSQFTDRLFAALVSIQYKPTIADMDLSDTFVAANNKELWNKKEVKQIEAPTQSADNQEVTA